MSEEIVIELAFGEKTTEVGTEAIFKPSKYYK